VQREGIKESGLVWHVGTHWLVRSGTDAARRTARFGWTTAIRFTLLDVDTAGHRLVIGCANACIGWISRTGHAGCTGGQDDESFTVILALSRESCSGRFLRSLCGRFRRSFVKTAAFIHRQPRVRTIIALAGFYFVSRDNWHRLLGCLVGFVTARILVTCYANSY